MYFAGKKHRQNYSRPVVIRPIIAAIITVIFFCIIAIPVFAATESAELSPAKVSVDIPTKFSSYTSSDIEKTAEFFKDMPISKNEAIKRVNNGVLINAFSYDKLREIRFTVNTDETSQKINNFSAMSAIEQKNFVNDYADGLKAKGHTFLSTPTVIELSGYSFIKCYARIGDSKIGYTYTSAMTIIGGKCYELTCYYNKPVLEQEQIDENEAVIRTLKVNISGNNGEINKNNLQIALSFIIMLAAAAVIIGVIISFVRPIIAKRNADESIKPKKSK